MTQSKNVDVTRQPRTGKNMESPATVTAFKGNQVLAHGPAWEVAVAVKRAFAADTDVVVLTFDDDTGRTVDFDLSLDEDQLEQQLRPRPEPAPPKSPGRPKLGVVAKEVTLLPRHWEWLSKRGNASATLRKLIDEARVANQDEDRMQDSRGYADGFMRAMLGDAPGHEEASRALYAGRKDAFNAIVSSWPEAPRDFLLRLAADAFAA